RAGTPLPAPTMNPTAVESSRVHGRWRVRPAAPIYDLRGIRIFHQRLTDVDLSGARMDGVVLEYDTLDGSSFFAASLCSAILDHSSLRNVRLDRATLRGTRLNDVDLRGSLLEGCDFRGSAALRSNLANADCRESNFQMSILEGAILDSAIFNESHFAGADLEGCSLVDTHLYHAGMGNTLIDVPRLERAFEVHYLLPERAIYPKLWLWGSTSDLVDIEIHHRDLSGYLAQEGVDRLAREYSYWAGEAGTSSSPWYVRWPR